MDTAILKEVKQFLFSFFLVIDQDLANISKIYRDFKSACRITCNVSAGIKI